MSLRGKHRQKFKSLPWMAALIAMGVSTLAQAGPQVDATAAKFAAHLRPVANGASAPKPLLNVTLPASAKAPRLPVRLDAPRSTPPGSRLIPLVNADSERKSEGGAAAAAISVPWRESRELVSPEVVSLIRNYRRDGLPLVHLYQSNQNLLAVGLNNHGVPGIYFTRHIGD